jgi:hypothetical protein
MEGLGDKIDRINSDVEKIISLYDYAEKLYPYEKIRDQRKVSAPFHNRIHRISQSIFIDLNELFILVE